jgi:hypothetical protein
MNIRLRENDRNEAHVRLSVFVGPEGQGRHAGELVFRTSEYPEFQRLIEDNCCHKHTENGLALTEKEPA